MTSGMPGKTTQFRWQLAAALSVMLLCGCGILKTSVSAQPRYYTLTYLPDPTAPLSLPSALPNSLPKTAALSAAPTLIISPPHAAAGFDSQRIMYMRHADQLEYFAYNEWIDTPARMLAPLMATTIEHSGAFRAVVQTPSPAAGEMRLDTEILRLQHEFLSTPSRVRFTLRAYLMDSATRRVIAARNFESVVAAHTDNPEGGVVAANRAVKNVLEALSAFCADAVPVAQLNK
jgi:cholesterol transport system auxiliary component